MQGVRTDSLRLPAVPRVSTSFGHPSVEFVGNVLAEHAGRGRPRGSDGASHSQHRSTCGPDGGRDLRGWALLAASNDDNSSSGTTQTTQPLPPARSVVKDVPAELVPSYQAAAGECPRVPWTFYAAMGKLSSDHGRDLASGEVRVEDGLVRGLVTLTEEHWAASTAAAAMTPRATP
jgi:hypothetical protein